ncbi:4'-phosphopantetheinyl transferase family protein [Streptomyces zaomyceticus]|uniref:4'-phosphopantetheinyl transferase family protein n=1 Tax=Streptomyces zaomyceticus TaxID=68286 RepID=UPI001676F517|nr:putative 4'-phosphopantetheinyl transferase [Streptomyces zaomyceticus]
MIGTLLPAPVSVAEAFEDPPGLTLIGLEREAVRTAAPKRLAEFTTARWCARRALAGLGMPPVPIPRGRRGAPVWPPGIVGSMTHHDGYRAAAVARQADARSLGIDAEPHLPLPDGVLELIALPAELRRIAELSGRHPLVHWDRLLFSMKESVYKAWFPLTYRWLGHEEADIVMDPAGTFTAHLFASHPRVPPEGFTGRWTVDRGLVVTSILVPPYPTPSGGAPR